MNSSSTFEPCLVCTSTEVVDDAGKQICGECGTERGAHLNMIREEQLVSSDMQTNREKETDINRNKKKQNIVVGNALLKVLQKL